MMTTQSKSETTAPLPSVTARARRTYLYRALSFMFIGVVLRLLSERRKKV